MPDATWRLQGLRCRRDTQINGAAPSAATVTPRRIRGWSTRQWGIARSSTPCTPPTASMTASALLGSPKVATREDPPFRTFRDKPGPNNCDEPMCESLPTINTSLPPFRSSRWEAAQDTSSGWRPSLSRLLVFPVVDVAHLKVIRDRVLRVVGYVPDTHTYSDNH